MCPFICISCILSCAFGSDGSWILNSVLYFPAARGRVVTQTQKTRLELIIELKYDTSNGGGNTSINAKF